MKEGDIIITGVPQSDGAVKQRPALVLRKLPTYDDYLVCGISTKLYQEINDFDTIIVPNAQNRLKTTSLIRLSFLGVIRPMEVRGVVGSISETLKNELLQRLAKYLLELKNE